MKWAPKIISACFCTWAVSGASAQHVKLTEGDLSALKSDQSINTQFTYDNMKVGKNENEADYVNLSLIHI